MGWQDSEKHITKQAADPAAGRGAGISLVFVADGSTEGFEQVTGEELCTMAEFLADCRARPEGSERRIADTSRHG